MAVPPSEQLRRRLSKAETIRTARDDAECGTKESAALLAVFLNETESMFPVKAPRMPEKVSNIWKA